MVDLESILKALTLAASAASAVSDLVGTVAPLLGEKDQEKLKEALAEARAANDEGFARLQAKLLAAAKE